MNFKDREYILFDLDGTITESGEGIMNGIRYSLEKIGRSELGNDDALLRSFIGPPFGWSYTNVFNLDQKTADRAIAFFREYYDYKAALYENKLYDGIIELFERLKANDKKIVLATSKPMDNSINILEFFDIKKYFYFIGASDFSVNRNDKKDVINYILTSCDKITSENCVMVGDRIYDIDGSRAFGIECIAVSYGYAPNGELKAARPALIVDTIKDLEKALI